MNPPVSWWWAAVAGLVPVSALPFVGQSMRADARPRCRWDGRVIDTLFRVRVHDTTGGDSGFCDVGCARSWVSRHPSSERTIHVTDEDSGEMLDAEHAFFVRSSIVTNPITGNRWHVFRDRDRADQHARESRGRLMLGADHPFPSLVELP